MVTILREADEKPVPEVAKKHGISAQTIYGWRKHFGSLEPADVKRLRHLEQEDVVVATPYTQRPPRFDYRLTATGLELAGALRLLATWGADRDPDAVPLHHGACGTPVEARWYCPTCARFVEGDETDELRFA